MLLLFNGFETFCQFFRTLRGYICNCEIPMDCIKLKIHTSLTKTFCTTIMHPPWCTIECCKYLKSTIKVSTVEEETLLSNRGKIILLKLKIVSVSSVSTLKHQEKKKINFPNYKRNSLALYYLLSQIETLQFYI